MSGGLRNFHLTGEYTKIGKPAQGGHLYNMNSFFSTKDVRFKEV